MFMTIGLVVLVLIVSLLVVGATKPKTSRIQRSASINVPPGSIFPLIDDFHRWSSWSPYEKLDPAMKRTLSGPARGKGAVYEWQGNNKAGTGRMEIIDTSPQSEVQIKLDFMKPFEAHNTARFTLEPRGDTTNVTWAMEGPSPLMIRVMSVFVSMDKIVGKDFETGLANMKTIAERG